MLIPFPRHPQGRALHDRVGAHAARVEAELERFESESRRRTRRLGLIAVAGAIGVVSFGAWMFRTETSTANLAILGRGAVPHVVSVMVTLPHGG